MNSPPTTFFHSKELLELLVSLVAAMASVQDLLEDEEEGCTVSETLQSGRDPVVLEAY